ncbi:biogenesis of lysosome-related organelles complex 1 subunit 5 [Drosophila albomicans]|uniref:Biogenesis of lysosome-related organelles complex 1 subunit 5 n=1 Tax=Drosophila albomicans TaxID=7291 RepID=A0A6P8XS22_DROAB|nr:biogenesis of lysosome-related organelles complex 1 subunit 5 [Drosophila albomicans]
MYYFWLKYFPQNTIMIRYILNIFDNLAYHLWSHNVLISLTHSHDGKENRVFWGKIMISQVGRELYKVPHRILDHRVFVNGEIEAFLDNFEVQRNDSEVETLFQVTETVGSLKYDLSDRCIALGNQNLSQLSTEVNTLLASVETLLEKAKVERVPSTRLQEARRAREQRKAEFLNNLQHGYQRIDNSFEEKEEEIAELYSDLQLKLNITK